MEFTRVVLFWFIVLSGLIMEGEEVMALTSCDIPAIYNFGDSNSDTGANAAAFFPVAAPCGETFFGRPAGRACDGRLIIDFIAEHLGLPHLSPYLDSIGTNFRHGANFATGGATIRRQNESWSWHDASPFSLDIQVENYIQFKKRTTYFYNLAKEPCDRIRLPRPEDFFKALYTFDIGQNDIGHGTMSLKQLRANIPDIVNQLAAAVQNLYNEGGRIFWIHNTGPMGCMPVATVNIRDPKPGYLDEEGCVKYQNGIAAEFNNKLKDKVIQLRAKLPHASLTYVDMYTAKYGLISNGKKQGFEDPFEICCGYHKDGIDVWCGGKSNINGTEIYAGSCTNPSGVISWDGVHYTEAANKWFANRLINGSLSDPPVPIKQACHKLL